MRVRLLYSMWIAAVLAGASCSGDTIDLVRDDSIVASFCIDRATTAEDRARGLRGAEPLCVGCGLLIEFPVVTEACIENDGVSFAIDVLYIDEGDNVVAIERDVPAGDATSRCHLDVLRVLEVTANAANPVLVGDQIEL